MTTTTVGVRASKPTALLALLAAGFVLIGVPTVIVGPILPLFISRWSLTDAQAGFFFTVQFAASICGVWITTAITSWRGYRPGLVLGYVLTAVGVALLNAPTHSLALVGIGTFGLGYGIVVPPTNLSGAEAGGAGMVSLLNFAWGIGAVACSPLVTMAIQRHFLQTFLFMVAVIALALAVYFLFATFPPDHHAEAAAAAKDATTPALAITVVMAALFFIYVGTETSIGGWAAADAKRVAGSSTSLALVTPMFFYAGLTAARGFAPLALVKLGELRVVLIALGLAILGVVVVLAATSLPVAIAGFTIAGLGCASVYPIYISWFSKWYGVAARRLGGVVFSVASFGGSAMPWLVGAVSTKAGSLRMGLLVPLLGCFAMLALLGLLRRARLV